MMIEQSGMSQKLVRRAVTIAMLSGLVLAAGTDWAAAATLQELTGPGTAGILAAGPGQQQTGAACAGQGSGFAAAAAVNEPRHRTGRNNSSASGESYGLGNKVVI